MIAILIVVLLLPSTVVAVTLPTLPQANVDVAMPIVNGSTLNATCANLQAQLNVAASLSVNLTHKVVLETGTTCTGPYKLPSHTGGSGWIIVTGPNVLPEGVRVSPSQAALMPKIRYGEDGDSHFGAITAQSGAQRYRIVGLELIQDDGIFTNGRYIVTGYGPQNALNTSHIIVDRVLCRDTNTTHESMGCLWGDAEHGHVAMIHSYAAGFKSAELDTQAFLAISNPGPILVDNNYLEAAAENLLLGGGDPVSESKMPKDITIKRNKFAKQPSWFGSTQWLSKTLLETKLGLRILIEANDFTDASWNDGGYAFRLQVFNQDNTAPWSEVSDMTIRHNKIWHVTNVFRMHSTDFTFTSKRSKRWHIHNNLIYDIGWACTPPGEASCGAVMVDGTDNHACTDPISGNCKMRDFVFSHNTIDDVGQWVFNMDPVGAREFQFKDNLINVNGGRGIFGIPAYGAAWLALVYDTTYVWSHNRMAAISGEGEDPADYPQATNTYPLSHTEWLWTNRTSRDYTLQPSSPAKLAASDGTDQGVNFPNFLSARSGMQNTALFQRSMPFFMP